MSNPNKNIIHHLKYVCLKERYEKHGDGDQLTDVLKPTHNLLLNLCAMMISYEYTRVVIKYIIQISRGKIK